MFQQLKISFKNWKTTAIGIFGLILTFVLTEAKITPDDQANILAVFKFTLTNPETLLPLVLSILKMFYSHDPIKQQLTSKEG